MTLRIRNPDTPADTELKELLSAPAHASFVMLAGAGSGKTTSLVKALDYIGARHGAVLRANGQQVACITYTEVAVAEIWSDVGNMPLFHVSTIHSFLWGLAKPFQANIAAWVTQHMVTKLEDLKRERDSFGARVQQRTRDRNAHAIGRLEQQIPEMVQVRQFSYGAGSNYREGVLGHDDIIKMVPALIQRYPLLVSLVMRKYPFFFVDESQDTFPNVIEALRAVAIAFPDRFTLGFFGDPMQKIYVTGVGDIQPEARWQRIIKPQNFRCPTKVLSVINRIRAPADGLEQTHGRHEVVDGELQPVPGSARMFVLPTDEQRKVNLERVRKWLADTDREPGWLDDSPDSEVRILVIEHRMAANQLGFADLHSAFTDDAPMALTEAYREGSAWPLRPFRDVLIPLAKAWKETQPFAVISALRNHSPAMEARAIKAECDPKRVLSQLKNATAELATLMAEDSTASVLDVLRFAEDNALLSLDERFEEYLNSPPGEDEALPPEADDDGAEITRWRLANTLRRFFACPAKQTVGYDHYWNDISRYATHQGVKGAEFGRVIVLIDDDESKHFQFSYEKLLGLKAPSKIDLENRAQGKETVFERTRRLLYVCCSRATKDLVVVLYTQAPAQAAAALRGADIFDAKDIYEHGAF